MAVAAGKRSRSTATNKQSDRDTPKRTKASSTTTETSTMAKKPEDRKLLMSMDYGTKTLSIAYRIARPGEEPSLTNIHDMRFSEDADHAPQLVAWSKKEEFYWGEVVERALKTKVLEPEDVIELWKLLLYKNHRTSGLAKRVKAQLKGKTSTYLISTHMKAVIEEVQAADM